MDDQEQQAARRVVTYVVQVERLESDDGPRVFVDIATVEVPPRTKRQTVIERGLAEAGVHPSDGPVAVRVLDARAAEVVPLVADVPVEPRWKVAGR